MSNTTSTAGRCDGSRADGLARVWAVLVQRTRHEPRYILGVFAAESHAVAALVQFLKQWHDGWGEVQSYFVVT